ncbi:neprilysin-1-like [Ixodes scapularis]|uniref:neprilysin-1-like n=1 Tax=Ixodes scapularis TaxID=6945 RepID=UPI001A9F7A2E|nr:neprilysin-1-like [Ixodes scapularis]
MEKTACIQDTFVAAARQYISSNVSSDIFKEENVMNAAVLRPMYNIFRRFAPGDGKVEIPGQTSKKLFFINWASTLCEPPQNGMYHKQSIVYKLGIPGKLSVNVALSRFPPFLDAFKCPPGSLIKSAKQCIFW